jgi:hypothetical protein
MLRRILEKANFAGPAALLELAEHPSFHVAVVQGEQLLREGGRLEMVAGGPVSASGFVALAIAQA